MSSLTRFSFSASTWSLASAVLASGLALSCKAETEPLRVCADPNNLPFSNLRQEGFENKLADLIGAELQLKVTYTWMPQRRSFFRRTLLAQECDVVMGVPTNFELVSATRPYYRSSYAFVSLRAKHLNIQSFDDRRLKKMPIGIHAVGAEGSNTPAAQALARHGLVHNIVGYPMWAEGNIDSPPGKVIDAVAKGDIGLAVVWGPFAGYFSKKYGDRLEVKPVPQTQDGLAFAYDISLGVRKEDESLKQSLQAVLDRRRKDVDDILASFHIPTADSERTTAER